MDWTKAIKGLFVVASFIVPACAGVSLDNIAVGATYHMTLTTGDELEGVVDSKTDTSLILDCKGSAYTFAANLIAECQLLAPPPSKTGGQSQAAESTPITFDQARQKQPGENLQVKIKSGAVFTGTLVSADNDNLRLNVEGSVIPIGQQVVDQIFVVPAKKAPEKQPAAAPAVPQAYDTIIVKNPEVDDYGRPKDNLTVIGNIVKEDNLRLTLTRTDNQQVSYTFDQIVRIFRHTSENPEEDQIKRYAKPLFCPPDMVLVDLPPGKANRPFFKVCIDKYEYPNRLNTVPQVNVSYDDAQKLCENAGKRLCTAQEWQWSCSGMEGYTYSYGTNFEKENCNTEGSRVIEPSGSRNKCISKFGAVDMTGNVFEWVKGTGGPAAMGGPVSKCATISPGAGGSAKPTIGLRCCKSN
ncbi:MAG TPA: SUMF1/EgtB/PvdO family nonheme iron enzyme [Chitinivibrionales bacterium]|nr:SUMF1/EgtB/PvdO family nonheme iron enzyme [Chitinivibrionales bacterium]